MAARKFPGDQDPKTLPPGVKPAMAKAALAGDSHTQFTAAELGRLVDEVWEHGRVMPEADGDMWRQDACGAWMRRDQFGDEASAFGWKIQRVSFDGTAGLRPFNAHNGFDLANGRPQCTLTADRSGIPAEKHAAPPRNKPC